MSSRQRPSEQVQEQVSLPAAATCVLNLVYSSSLFASPAGVQRPNEQVTELVSLFDAATRRKVAAARRAAGQRTQRFGFFQRVKSK